MVLGGPRSGTTWAANWLSADSTICLHDPLMEYTRAQLDRMEIPGKRIGISCTSTLLFPEWYEKHPAKKILLWRDPEEINVSLEQLGLPVLDVPAHLARLKQAIQRGIPVYNWHSLLHTGDARDIWTHLTNLPFDPYRHDMLTQFNVQPQFKRLPVSREAVHDLVKRTKEVIV